MNNIDEIALIALVKKYPLLYDMTSPLYLDQSKKEEAWQEIATVMSATAYDCKSKWTRLRDNYRKARILRKENSSRGKDQSDRPIKYENEMAFLNAKYSLVGKKRQRTALHKLDSSESNEEPKVKIPALNNPSLQTEPKNRLADTKRTEMHVFFEGIAETVKTLPKKIQIQLKRKIFNIVNEAEASVLEMKEVWNKEDDVANSDMQPLQARSDHELEESNEDHAVKVEYDDEHVTIKEELI